jgi:hypothetical protein
LRLAAADQRTLKEKRGGRQSLSERRWHRIRILELFASRVEGDTDGSGGGTYPREVRRVGWRYLERGLAAALSDDPRPKPTKLLDAKQQAAIVAMVCGPPPGHARWTIVLTALKRADAEWSARSGGRPSAVCL